MHFIFNIKLSNRAQPLTSGIVSYFHVSNLRGKTPHLNLAYTDSYIINSSFSFISELRHRSRYNIHYAGPPIHRHSRMSLDTMDYFVKQISHLFKGVVIETSA